VASDGDLPERIAHFRVLSLLGKGGMGVVYRAEDEKLRRVVALKVLPAAAEGDDERRRRFMREARSAASLTHPNIAAVHEVGEDAGRIYIAMELVEGETLRRRIAAGPLPVREAVRIARAIARGLARAHAKGVLHRDLKPDNVLLDPEGEPKILDFGLAKLHEPAAPEGASAIEKLETASHDTKDGQLLGTPGYMSPEQAKGTVDVDERSDVFSLGVVLYEMLAGKRPFRGDATLDVLIAASRDKPEPLTGVPPEVAAIVDKCLAKRPEDRYANARAVVEAMDAVQSTPGDRSLLSGPSIPSAEVKSSPTTLGSTVDTRPARRGVRALAAAALLVLAGAGAFVAWRSRAAPAATPAAVVGTPASSADASRRGVALTDHAPPRTGVPEAATAYGQALQALRDASLVIGLVQLERAARLDPTLAPAQLRLALLPSSNRGATSQREHLAAAEQLRSALDERDQMLLRLAEADLADPRDAHEVLVRARAAAARFPDDAEVSWHLGNALLNVGHLEEARGEWQRGLELDPAYAMLLWELGGSYWFYGTHDEEQALAAYARCLEIAPTAGSCRRRRDSMYMELGQCDKLEADARSMAAAEPNGTRPYEFLAMALAAENAPPDAIAQTLSRRVSVTPEGEARVEMQVQNTLWSALLVGDLGTAEQAARQLIARAESTQTESEHDRPMGYLLDILQERGDVDRALAEAEAFERKAAAWAQDDPLGVRLRLVFMRGEAGRLDRAAQAAAVEGLLHSGALAGEDEKGRELAVARQGLYLTRPEQAAAVLASLGDAGIEARGGAQHGLAHALEVGRARFIAGAPARALAPLRYAAQSCKILMDEESDQADTLHWIHAHVLLGQALEQTGDTPGACAAYAAVLDRWKDAKPRSLSLETARGRSKALACAAP
jgi:serine/threonine-protein kinase